MGGHGLSLGEERGDVGAAGLQHVFAHQKGLLNLTIRTIGLARARVKIGLANLAYNMRRFIWLLTKYVPA